MLANEREPIQISRFVRKESSILDVVVARTRERSKAGDLMVIGTRNPFSTLSYNSGFDEGTGIFTAPREPVYEAEALTAFMENLFEGIDGIKMTPTKLPEQPDVARRYAMSLGAVFFTDIIGRKTEVIDLAESPQPSWGLSIGKPKAEFTITSSDITRATTLLVYPHIRLAQAALGRREPDLENGWIKRNWLERLQQGYDPFQEPPSILGRLVAHL